MCDRAHGIFHVANGGEISWAELARRAARMANVSDRALIGVSTEELGLVAPRPRYSALASVRGHLVPELDHALRRWVERWHPDASRDIRTA